MPSEPTAAQTHGPGIGCTCEWDEVGNPVGGEHKPPCRMASAAHTPWRCKIGLHRWPALGTTIWLDDPRPDNRFGSAMEYRACERCGKLRDITTWFDVPDPDFGVPQKVGPLAWARMQEVMRGPRVPLACPPIPWSDDA